LITLKIKPKRSRAMIIMVLPALIFFFAMGWVMCCLGEKKGTHKMQPIPNSPESVVILPLVSEELQIPNQ
jgi:hypothetical protein